MKRSILVEIGKFLDLEIAAITIDALMKDMKRKMLHHLRENRAISSPQGIVPPVGKYFFWQISAAFILSKEAVNNRPRGYRGREDEER